MLKSTVLLAIFAAVGALRSPRILISDQTIEDVSRQLQYVSGPVVVLVQEDDGVANLAEGYVDGILNKNYVRNELWLMKFNATATSDILAKTTEVDLDSFQGLFRNKYNSYLGGISDGGSAFFGIIVASKALNYGGAVLIFVRDKIVDEDLALLANKAITDKNIKVFTVWLGGRSGAEELIKETSLKSGGGFYEGRKLSNVYSGDDSMPKSILAHRTNIQGKSVLRVPIDTSVTSIHVGISGAVIEAHFVTPRNYLINLLDSNDIGKFSKGSFGVRLGDTFDIKLDTAHGTQTPTVGTWRLEIEPAPAQKYNFTISIQTKLTLSTKILTAEGGRRRRVKLDLQGDFGQISNISLIDNLGDALKVLDQNSSTAETFEIETIKEQQFDFDEKSVPEQALYVKVDGKDLQGNDFVRLSYLNSNIQPKHPIEIEIDSNTDLLLRPNQNVKIYFEVTNNQNYVVYVNFKCEDNKRLLRWMEPLSTWMQPRQTKVVAVTIFTRNDFGSSYQDFVTFYAMTGQEKYIKKILLNVDAKHVVDTRKPTIWHKFTSNCLNVLLANCEDATWSVEITAQDKESGLMLLTPNIHFPNGFTTGTTEEVTGYYSASCCESQLQLTATDRSNNKRTYIIDAYKATLGPWAIAAIVFGVLLIIALIVGIILAIVCRRKQKVSVDLPTTSYRGPINSASTNRY